VINAKAQMLDTRGQPIPVYMAPATASPRPRPRRTGGAGATIGPAMTFGTIAARHAVAERVKKESGMNARSLGPGVGLVILILACQPVASLAGDASIPSLSLQVQPIFDANCVACHQAGAAQQGLVLESGIAFRNVNKRSSEAALNLIEAGKPEASYLFQKLNGTGQGARMPLGGALDAADIDTIRLWILGGAKND
jgi:mono/diheme cytochrome c family protein